jgi:hypothetical protein
MMHHEAYQIGIGGWNVPRFSSALGENLRTTRLFPGSLEDVKKSVRAADELRKRG